MKVSDYVVDFLVRRGAPDIFMVAGGGIMHLVDSVGRHPGVRYYCNYHEQACAIAAEAYARVRNGVGACLVTTGPGSTNALSGIAGAFVDSIPVMVISGQVRRDLIADYSKLRQLGPQEINIEPMARPVVKYFKTLMEPAMLRYELECAWWRAVSGRPGPVWINVPLDVQGADFDEKSSPPFEPPAADGARSCGDLRARVAEAVRMLRASKRPVVIGGNGIHLGRAHDGFARFVEKVGAPVLLTIGGMDLMGEGDGFYQGKFGPLGQRRGNFALQNSDLVLSLGASMSVACVGFNTAGLAPRAKRIMVNVDAGELAKATYRADLAIHADVGLFMEAFLRETESTEFRSSPRWMEACEAWKRRYPILTPDLYEDERHVNSYVFTGELSDLLGPEAVVVTGNALDAWSVYQTFKVKRGQRVFTNVNYGSMGWDLPAAVGACVAQGNKRTILITGDGGFQFNVQELLTIGRNRLDVKIFVFNNRGYASIRGTQTAFFEGHFVGADEGSGIGNPDFAKVAAAYGLGYDRIETNDQIRGRASEFLAKPGPALCELNVAYSQDRRPRASSFRREDGALESRPLEEMFPFLPREEILENMRMCDGW